MWNPSLFFICNNFHRTLNNFCRLHPHMIKVFMGCCHSHPPCLALPSCGDLSHHNGHRQDHCDCRLFALSDRTHQFSGLCNINEWRKRHRSHTVDRFGCNFVCQVIHLPTSPWKCRGRNSLTKTCWIRNCTYRDDYVQSPQSNLPISFIYTYHSLTCNNSNCIVT